MYLTKRMTTRRPRPKHPKHNAKRPPLKAFLAENNIDESMNSNRIKKRRTREPGPPFASERHQQTVTNPLPDFSCCSPNAHRHMVQ